MDKNNALIRYETKKRRKGTLTFHGMVVLPLLSTTSGVADRER